MKEDEWSLLEYRAEDSNEMTLFRKNFSSIVEEKKSKYSFLIYLTFIYEPVENGFPSSEDNDTFEFLEKNDFVELEERTDTLLVAVVTKSRVKDFLFYSENPEKFLEEAFYLIDTYKQFKIECEYSEDSKWEQYEDFPS